jgi:hypothetical protein
MAKNISQKRNSEKFWARVYIGVTLKGGVKSLSVNDMLKQGEIR